MNVNNKGISIVYSLNSEHQKQHAMAVKKGFAKLGIDAKLCNSHHQVTTENVVIWGWRGSEHHTRYHRNIIVLERGYIGDRFKYTSIATNGLNGFGTFHTICDIPDRFNTLFGDLYKDWNSEGDYILLMGQTPGDMSLRGIDLTNWYFNKAKEFSDKLGLPVYFRQHPNLTKKGIVTNVPGTQNLDLDLDSAISGAKIVVTFNSNSGIDALLAGKPTYIEDQGSLAYSVANNNIENISFDEPLNRKDFFNKLAWTQYSIKEIETGFPLTGVNK